jgi:hypothetical protein
MSNRQARNRAKATKRMRRVLSYTTHTAEYRAECSTGDYNTMLRVCLICNDGTKFASAIRARRLWRHMEHMPYRMTQVLAVTHHLVLP